MLDTLFQGLFDTAQTTVISPQAFLACVISALVMGLLLAFLYTWQTRATKSFAATLALLPAVVCVVIMLVNGNIGTGVAVAGAFGLIRFRSAPGSAREIGAVFLAMGIGLAAGMGYIGYAFLITLLLGGASVLLSRMDFGAGRHSALLRTMRVTIPESLDYTGVFDDLFEEFTVSHELSQVKTTNMGSLFKLTYQLTLKDAAQEKKLIDKIRCRNGNLEISVSAQDTSAGEL